MARRALSGMLLLAALVAGAAGAGPVAAAVVYRWTDEAGRVHFGQVPPPGRPFEALQVPGGQGGEAPPAPPPRAAEAMEREEGREGTGAPRPEAAAPGGSSPGAEPVPAADCDRARRTLETLRSRPPSRVLVRAPDGTVRRMTEAEHREQVERLRRLLARRCGGR